MILSASRLKSGTAIFGLAFYLKVIPFFLTIIFGSQSFEVDADAEGNIFNQIIGLLIFLLNIFFLLRDKSHDQMSLSTKAIFLIFILIAISSISWSYEPEITFRRLVGLICVITFAYFISKQYTIERFVEIYCIIIGVAASIGIVIAVAFPSLVFVDGGLRDGAFIGIFQEKNAAARINAYAMFFSLVMIFVTAGSNKYLKLFFPFILISFLLSKSATAFGIILFSCFSFIYFYLLDKAGFLRKTVFFIIALFSMALFCTLVYLNFDSILMLLNRDPTLTDRTEIWDLLSESMLDEFIFGYGFGAFWGGVGAEEFIRVWGYIGNAHNGYFETMLHGGVVFLISSLLVLATSLYSSILQLRKYAESDIFPLYLLSFIFCAVFIVINIIAYVMPNYRAVDFLIFLVFYFQVAKKYIGR